MGLKHTGGDAHAQRAQGFDEFTVEFFAQFGGRGVDETGTALAARIAVESELRDGKNFAAGIQEGAIHLSLVIVENSQVHDFFGHIRGGRGGVVLSDGHEDDEPGPDFANGCAIDDHAPAGGPLEDDSHDFRDMPGAVITASILFADLAENNSRVGWCDSQKRRTVLETECFHFGTNLKLALIGTHGVGKTTLAYELCSLLKKSHHNVELVTEVARHSPFPVNAATTIEGQLWILHAQIAAELDAGRRAPQVIADRSVLDNYCYLVNKFGRQPQLEPWLGWWMDTYDVLVGVPPVAAEIPADGFRSEDRVFQRRIHELLIELLSSAPFNQLRSPVQWLKADERIQWADRIVTGVSPLLNDKITAP